LWASAVLCLAAIGWLDQLLRQAGGRTWCS
jgi:hypothetical protein